MTAASSSRPRVAIVTGGGASPGRVPSIGEAVCRLLAAQGHAVAVVDIDPEAAERTVTAIKKEGGRAVSIAADLTAEEECRRAISNAVEWLGRVEVLVNSVGAGGGSIVTETDEAQLDYAIALNFKSAIFMIKYVIPHMSGGAAIVNLSTTAIDHPTRSLAYGATKAAVEALTKHTAFQFGMDGIRCNTVRPGEVWTAMVDRNCPTEEAAEHLRAERARRTVLPTEGDAWDIAHAVAFLASDEARWITGQTLSVDGGAQLIRPNPDWQSHPSYWKAKR